jgi:hypothetical protein
MDRVARRNRRREMGTLFNESYDGIGVDHPRAPDAPPLGGTLVLFVVQVLLSGGLVFVAAVSAMITDSCGSRSCNFALIEFSAWIVPIGVLAVFLACVALCVWNYNRSRATWWIPIAGIAASVLILLASIGLLQWGMGPIGG